MRNLLVTLCLLIPSTAWGVQFVRQVPPSVASPGCLSAGITAIQSVYPGLAMDDVETWQCKKDGDIWTCGIEYDASMTAADWAAASENGDMPKPTSVDGSTVHYRFNGPAVQLTADQVLAHANILGSCLSGVEPTTIKGFAANRDGDDVKISYQYLDSDTAENVAALAEQGLVVKIWPSE